MNLQENLIHLWVFARLVAPLVNVAALAAQEINRFFLSETPREACNYLKSKPQWNICKMAREQQASK